MQKDMIKRLLLVICIGCLMGCNGSLDYEIEQQTVKWLDYGYNVQTFIWKDGEIIWSHCTFQEARIYIPLDSVPQVRARDYETAKKMVELFKQAKYP